MLRLKPSYDGGGIVNLMSSLIQARGGQSDAPALERLPVEELTGVAHLLLLVVDGLGADWLQRRAPESLLARTMRTAITSVFPPTTAAAIPTYLTGDPPLRHGLTGWFTYLRELGAVMTVLPGMPRYGGVSYRRAGVDPRGLFTNASVFDRIRTRGVCISPAFIAHSDFNRALTGQAEILTFETLEQMLQQCLKVIRPAGRWGRSRTPTGPSYVYLYWPWLDSIGHAQGIESDAALKHLLEIDQAIQGFMSAARGTSTMLLVCADHGQIDTSEAEVIDLARHADLAECLRLPLCGEPRAGFCYLCPGATERFADYCRDRLAGQVELIPSRQLVDEGYFGLGARHPRIMDRVGDYCLLPLGARTLRDLLPSESPHAQVGVHGGLSAAELMVPLCVLSP